MSAARDVDVILLTEARYERPSDANWYVRQVLDDDRLLAGFLEQRGLSVERADWARRDEDWSRAKLLVFRTTWDYFYRFEKFAAWLDGASRTTRLLNDAGTVRWNADKHYLRDLGKRGVNVVRSEFVERGASLSLPEAMDRFGLDEAVFKPAIGGTARHAHRVTRATAPELADTFADLVAEEAFLLQPFVRDVVERGELSLMVIGGRFTHAVRKVAKPGDFRVQDDHGGSVHEHEATPEEIAFAEQTVASSGRSPAYARVDVVHDDEGKLALMELELIEPELFFRFHPPAAERLAEAIAGALS